MASLNQPTPPPNFTFVDETEAGRYILGHDKFYVSDEIHITNWFQRDISRQDDIYLGILSVILIAIFSEILHTFILRSAQNSTPSRSRLVSAFLISEFAHFRNVIRHYAPITRIIERPRDGLGPTSTISGPKLSPFRLSLKILFFTLLLFIADFLSIFYTQQTEMSSGSHEYNLRAYQPSAATLGQSRYIRRLVSERPCVSPFIITNSTSKDRNYQLLTCVKLDFEGTPNANNKDVAQNVSIESFFHRGGSDHMITYGSGFVTVSVRAQVILSKAEGGARRLLFVTNDDEQFTLVKYIHRLTFHAAAEWVCRRDSAANENWCNTQRAEEPQFASTTKTKEIQLWTGKTDEVIENHMGLVSTFQNINFPNSTKGFNSGVRWLISNGFVQEEIGISDYERVRDDVRETGIAGLLTETGRKLGVLAMLIALSFAVIVMTILRQCLQPVSLGEIVIRNLDKTSDTIGPNIEQRDVSRPSSFDTSNTLRSIAGTMSDLQRHNDSIFLN